MKFKIVLTPENNISRIPSSPYDTCATFYNVIGEDIHNKLGMKPIAIGKVYQNHSSVDRTYEDSDIIYTGDVNINIGVLNDEMSVKIYNKLNKVDNININGNQFKIKHINIIEPPKFEHVCIWNPVYGILTKSANEIQQEAEKLNITVSEVKLRGIVGNKGLSSIPSETDDKPTANLLVNSIKKHYESIYNETSPEIKILIDRSIKSKTVTMKHNTKSKIWQAKMLCAGSNDIQKLIWTLGVGVNTNMGLGEVNLTSTKNV